MSDVYWDPFDEDIDTDPYDVWRRMRDEAPLYRNDRYDFWALSRYDDVEAAHRDAATFSSAHGTVLEFMGPEPLRDRSASSSWTRPSTRGCARSCRGRSRPGGWPSSRPTIRELCAEMLDAQRRRDELRLRAGLRRAAAVAGDLVAARRAARPTRTGVREHIDQVFHIEPGVGMINDVSFRRPDRAPRVPRRPAASGAGRPERRPA